MGKRRANKRAPAGHAYEGRATQRTQPATSSISWLQVPGEADVPNEVRDLWRKANEKLGFIPNVMRAFALRPDHFLGWWRYYDHLMRGPSALSKVQREMIAVVVSSANRCHY